MNILKRIGLGLSGLLAISLLFLALPARSALAAPNFNLQWFDGFGTKINGHFNSGTTNITFVSVNNAANLTNWEYQDSGSNAGDPIAACGNTDALIKVPRTAAQSGAATTAYTEKAFSYKPSSTGACTNIPANTPLAIASYQGNPAPQPKIDWTGAKGKIIDSLGSQVLVTFSDGSTVTFQDKTPGDRTINFKPLESDAGKNVGGITIADWCQNTVFGSNDAGYGLTLSSYKDTTATVKICYTNATDPSTPKTQITDTADGKTIAMDVSAYNPTPVDAQTAPACSLSGSTNLAWLLCPVIDGMSHSADYVNTFVAGQLNFSVKDNLPPGGSVQKAWTIFKDLASVAIIIVLLIMVISQAVGGGPFDAYTIRKLLPKLVAAVIVMQVSWQICIWLIGLANDAGQGIAELIAAPFGGISALELPQLITRLNNVVALGVGTVTTAGAIATLFAASAILVYGWPVLLLAVIMIVIAVLAALATLLVRNAMIIILVMLAPLAFLSLVLPGTAKYWKVWKDNFMKLLMFFPLVMTLIYGGRIFAWIAGGLGNAGMFDFIAVLAGFFGPYFFLPKSFKWGGSVLAAASNGIQNSWPIKKGREVAGRELMAAQMRNIRDYGKANLDPAGDPNYFRYKGLKRNRFGLPVGINREGKLGHTLMTNVLGGRVLPTRRNLGQAISAQDKNDAEEKALEEAIAARGRQKATAREEDIAAGKEMSVNQLESELTAAANSKNSIEKLRHERSATAALGDLINSRSFYELARMKITDPKDGQEKFIWETDFWRDKVAGNSEFYRAVSQERPDWQPHRLPTGLPKYRGDVSSNWESNLRQSLTEENVPAEEIEQRVAERRTQIDLLKSGDTEARYAEALGEVMSETDARKLSTVSPIMFERIGQMAESGAKLQTQIEDAEKTGNTELAHRLQVKQSMLMKPAKLFNDMVNDLITTGNEYQLSQIMGGQEATGMVNLALKYTGPERVKGGGEGIVERMQRFKQGRGAPNTPTEGTTTIREGASGGTSIRHGQSATSESRPSGSSIGRETITRMSPQNAQNWIESRGGPTRLSDEDLITLYNQLRGQIQKDIRGELEKRNLMSPAPASPILSSSPGTAREPSASAPAEPPAPPRSTPEAPSSPGTVIPPGIPPEDFGPGGRFPPPNV